MTLQPSAIADYGPQLNGFTNKAGEGIRLMFPHILLLKTEYRCTLFLQKPLPLNVLEVVLDATVDFAL